MMTLFAASVCPSDWGWNADVMCSLVPASRMSSHQKADVKMGSRSKTMDCETSWRRTISAKNAWATDFAVSGVRGG